MDEEQSGYPWLTGASTHYRAGGIRSKTKTYQFQEHYALVSRSVDNNNVELEGTY